MANDTQQAIDLSSLHKSSDLQLKLPRLVSGIIILFILVPMLAIVSVPFAGSAKLALLYSAIPWLIGLILSGLVIGGAVLFYVIENKRQKSISAFAQANNLAKLDSAYLMQLIPPSLRGVGRQQKAVNGFALPIAGRIVVVFEYSYTTGSGKSRKVHNFSLAAFNTKESYPHIFLDGKINGVNSEFSVDQRISLEGDFDKHFQLYAPEGGRVAALAILTPDVIQTMIRAAWAYDVEIVDRTVFLISDLPVYTQAGMDRLQMCIKALAGELDHRDKTWRPVVSDEGSVMTLKKRIKVWEIAIGVAVLLFLFSQFVLPLVFAD